MDAKLFMIEPLLERAEQYGKTSLELMKLKSINKTSDLISVLVFKLLLMITVSFFLLLGSVALSIYTGSLLGENYYGFLVVSGGYALICCILLLFKKMIQKKVKKSLVTQILN